MKVVPESFFHKHVIEPIFKNTRVLNLPHLEIESLNRDEDAKLSDPFIHCCLILLSNNRIDENGLQLLWKDFPSSWWLYMANNRVSKLNNLSIPLAMSTLDLTNNPISMEELHCLHLTHILRLHVSIDVVSPLGAAFDKTWDSLLSINQNLHLVWVFNNHFISHQDRTFVLQKFPLDETRANANQTGVWSSLVVSTRQSTIVNATHHLERIDDVSDTVRLDILLEDYLHECLSWNNFAHSVSVSNTVTIRNIKKRPLISNINSILFVPHRLRIDLSVLLTTRLIYSIPNPLFHDSLIILLGEFVSSSDIEALLYLPPFALTALISLLRRISATEHGDIVQGQMSRLQALNIVPTLKPQYAQEFTPTYDSAHGFQFLRDAQRYLMFRFQATEEDSHQTSLPFSELEVEILQQLPDIPTKWCGYESICKNESDAKLRRWVPFACRHAIFILNKAPSCPPLNGVCRSSKDQEFYLEMLPLLKAANMSLVDLDIFTVGPQGDGRAMANPMHIANLHHGQGDHSESSANVSQHRRRLETAMKLMQGKVLPFGMGLPNATLSSLNWTNNDNIARPYEKPWQANTKYATVPDEAQENGDPQGDNEPVVVDSHNQNVGGTFFMTGDVYMQQFSLQNNGSMKDNAAGKSTHSLHDKRSQIVRHNYLDNYDNPLANRPPPRIMESGKEIYKLDTNEPLFRPVSPTSSSVIIPKTNEGPSYVVQDVSLQYLQPASRAITPGTWTAGRNSPNSNSQVQVDGRMSPNQSSRAMTTIFPLMPTNFHEMKNAVSNGGVLEGDAYNDASAMNNNENVIPVHELFPPEFRPHSSAQSIHSFNTKINQVLSVLSAAGSSPLSCASPSSPYSTQRKTSVVAQNRRVDSEGVEVDDVNAPVVQDDTTNDDANAADVVSVKSLVSISLPSIDGAKGGAFSRNNTAPSFSDTMVSNDEFVKVDARKRDGNITGLESLTPDAKAASAAATSRFQGDPNSDTYMQQQSNMIASAAAMVAANGNSNQLQSNTRSSSAKSPSRLHTVNVFTADNLWNPQFFVAPSNAIDSFNKHFQLFQYYNNDNNPASFQHHYWRSIQQAPVVLIDHENSKRVLDPQLLIKPQSPPRTVFLHSLEYPPNPIVKSPPRSPTHSKPSSRMPSPSHSITGGDALNNNNNVYNNARDDENESHLTDGDTFYPLQDVKERDGRGNVIYDDELHSARDAAQKILDHNNKFHSNSSFNKNDMIMDRQSSARSAALSDATPSYRGLAASLSDDFGKPIPVSEMENFQFPFTSLQKKSSSAKLPSSRLSSSKNTSQLDEEYLKKAAEDLLRDMGTLRNMRELQAFNEHISSLRMSADGKVYKVAPPTAASTAANAHLDMLAGFGSDGASLGDSITQGPIDMTLVNEMLATQRPKLSLLVTSLGRESNMNQKTTNTTTADNTFFFTEAPGQPEQQQSLQNEQELLAEEQAYYAQYRRNVEEYVNRSAGQNNSLQEASEVTYGDGTNTNYNNNPMSYAEGYNHGLDEMNDVNNNFNNNIAGFDTTNNMRLQTASDRVTQELEQNKTLLGMNVLMRDLSHTQVAPSMLHEHIRQLRHHVATLQQQNTTLDPNNVQTAVEAPDAVQIFSEETLIDQVGHFQTVSGAKVSAPFYPVYPKVVYRVRAEDALTASYNQQLQQQQSNRTQSSNNHHQKPAVSSTVSDANFAMKLQELQSAAKHMPGTPFSPASTPMVTHHLSSSNFTLKPITPKVLTNAILTPADSLSVASQSQHGNNSEASVSFAQQQQQQTYHSSDDFALQTEEFLIAAEERKRQESIAQQNLQVLQQSKHFQHLLQANKKGSQTKSHSSKSMHYEDASQPHSKKPSKITELLTLPTRAATRYSNDNAKNAYYSDPNGQQQQQYFPGNHGNMDYTAPTIGQQQFQPGSYYDQSQQPYADMFQDSSVMSQPQQQPQQQHTSISFSVPGTVSVKNSFSEVVEGLRGSLAAVDDVEYLSPPPMLLSSETKNIGAAVLYDENGQPLRPFSPQGSNNNQRHSIVSALSGGGFSAQNVPPISSSNNQSSNSSSMGGSIQRPPPLTLFSPKSNHLLLKQYPHLNSGDDMDISTVASAASSASSGLNEQGSQMIYQAYSAQVNRSRSPPQPLQSIQNYHSDIPNLVAVGGSILPSSNSPTGNKNNNNNPSGSGFSPPKDYDFIHDYNYQNQNQQQPLKKVVISKSLQNFPSYQLNRSSSAVSQTSHVSGMLMNLSLSNGSLQSGSLAMLTERGSLLQQQQQMMLASKGSNTNNAFANNKSTAGKRDRDPHAKVSSGSPSVTSSPSLMILAPKSAEALLALQQQQQQQQQQGTSGKPHLRPVSSANNRLLPPVHTYNNTSNNNSNSNAQLVKPHRRLRSISGREDPTTQKVWVGKQAYKAATAKLTVDPAFRLPTMVAYEKRAQEQAQWEQAITMQQQQQQQQQQHYANNNSNYYDNNNNRKDGRTIMTMADMFPPSSAPAAISAGEN